MGVGKVRRAINGLVELGLIEVVWKDDTAGRKKATKYRFRHRGGMLVKYISITEQRMVSVQALRTG